MPKRVLMDQGVECHQLGKCDPLQWPSDCRAVFQPCEAGYINPRKLILAQQKLAKRNNCTMLDDAVVTKVNDKMALTTKPLEDAVQSLLTNLHQLTVHCIIVPFLCFIDLIRMALDNIF